MNPALVAALLVLALPTAVADCIESGSACIDESAAGPEGCEAAGDVHYAETMASVATEPLVLRVVGSRSCANDGTGTTRATSLIVTLGVSGVWTTFTWADATSGCSVQAGNSGLGRDVERRCPLGLGPVDPGWGRLLP